MYNQLLHRNQIPHKSIIGKTFKILTCFFGHYHQCKRCCIGSNYQIFRKSSFKPQTRYSKCTILIVLLNIDTIISRFRNTPWNTSLFSIFNLSVNSSFTCLVKQTIFIFGITIRGIRYSNIEPLHERRIGFSVDSCQKTSKCKPAFLRYLVLCDSHKTR